MANFKANSTTNSKDRRDTFPGRFDPIELSDPALELGGLRNLTFYSEALRGRGDVSLWVPEECAGATGVPRVVLLHGVYGSHWSWFFSGAAHVTARRLMDAGEIGPMVLVSPSDGLAGDGTGYLPRPGGGYEGWIVRDVVDCIPVVVPCTAGGPVFLAGLSMGGYGALRLGMKWPDRFAAISAHSAITNVSQFAQFVRHGMDEETLAPGESSLLHWASLHRDTLPPLRFDCGRDDDLFSANEQLHAELNGLGIAHSSESFEGAHTWPYWQTHLADTLRFFDATLKRVR